MNRVSDLLLGKPIPEGLLRGLLFTTFTLHLLFVLLALGTAILAVYFFIDSHCGGQPQELRFDRKILRTFMAHKSLAVVLGIAPLLLIQVGFTIPFFTAVNLFAPFWIALVVLLIFAFISFDLLGHRIYVHRYIHVFFGIVALALLLMVPGIFVAILTAFENPGRWQTIVDSGYRLPGDLAVHWLFRYLHVLGAAVVFGAGFHYFFVASEDTEKKSLQKWFVAGILFQFVLGILLYGLLPERAGYSITAFLGIGITAAAFLLWIVFSAAIKNLSLNSNLVVPVLLIVFVSMLLTRQFLQDRTLLPLQNSLEANATTYKSKLTPFDQPVLATYGSSLQEVYDNGETIYLKSCSFCHGKKGEGAGLEAKSLVIAPENIAAIRTTRRNLQRILTGGIAGSAMPYFTVFDRYKIDSLINYLDLKYHVLSSPEPSPINVSDAQYQQAGTLYDSTCSLCHGKDGRGATLSKNMQPLPPDFTVYSLTSEKTFDVITHGYPGTAMFAYGSLPADVRWALVKIIHEKRRQ